MTHQFETIENIKLIILIIILRSHTEVSMCGGKD